MWNNHSANWIDDWLEQMSWCQSIRSMKLEIMGNINIWWFWPASQSIFANKLKMNNHRAIDEDEEIIFLAYQLITKMKRKQKTKKNSLSALLIRVVIIILTTIVYYISSVWMSGHWSPLSTLIKVNLINLREKKKKKVRS